MADETVKVYDSFFEDDNADYVFYYTGKSDILGLQQPDHVYKNKNDFKYARLAFIKFIDSGDPDLLTHIMEDLTITFLSDIYGDEEDAYNNTSVHVRLRSCARNCRVLKTYTNLATEALEGNGESLSFVATEEAYEDTDGKVKYGLGLWVESDISKFKYILINVNSSLSVEGSPINGESFYPSSYNIEYLNDNTAVSNENVTNATVTGACGSKESFQDKIDKRLDDLEQDAEDYRPVHDTYTVVYDVSHTPTSTEEPVNPTSIRKSDVTNDAVLIDNVNKGIRIKTGDSGVYILQLKNGFYLIKGTTRLDLNVYKNNVKIEELCMSMYLTSNGEEDARKAIKNTFTSLSYYTELVEGDNIVLKAIFTNPDGLTIENETMLMLTKIQKLYLNS